MKFSGTLSTIFVTIIAVAAAAPAEADAKRQIADAALDGPGVIGSNAVEVKRQVDLDLDGPGVIGSNAVEVKRQVDLGLDKCIDGVECLDENGNCRSIHLGPCSGGITLP